MRELRSKLSALQEEANSRAENILAQLTSPPKKKVLDAEQAADGRI